MNPQTFSKLLLDPVTIRIESFLTSRRQSRRVQQSIGGLHDDRVDRVEFKAVIHARLLRKEHRAPDEGKVLNWQYREFAAVLLGHVAGKCESFYRVFEGKSLQKDIVQDFSVARNVDHALGDLIQKLNDVRR